WAAPFVANGKHGCVEVESRGIHHTIEVTLDRIAQQPRISPMQKKSLLVKTGTVVKLHWPQIASSLQTDHFLDFYNAEPLLLGFACFNPHAFFSLRAPGIDPLRVEPTDTNWQKWRPDRPTCPHWYTEERFRRLVAALISEERRGRPPLTARAF